MRDVLARAVYLTGTVVGRSPAALALARRRGHGEVLDGRTDLVVEGFPRSGNTLAVVRIAAAQPETIRIAHHVHAPGHVIAAVRRALPCIVLVREPDLAVTEFVALKPFLTVADALRGYVGFYAPLVRSAGRVVVARTADVEDDLAGVVRRVNARFGTSFAEPGDADPAGEREAVASYWPSRRGAGLPLVGRTPAPGDVGDGASARLMAEYRSERLAPRRRRAEALYRAFVSRTSGSEEREGREGRL